MMLRIGCASLALALFTQFSAPAAEARPDRRDYRSDRSDDRSDRTPVRSDRRADKKSLPPAEQPKAVEAEGPLLMLISLNQQRMYVYDANGFVVTTRVSTGMAGFDTPKGIYSILEKKEDHASNIYEGAPMPHMQRLLMTGIAMHGGVVPGYPASHGCIRLPFDFARKFFDMTTINQRVVVAPDVQSPIGIEHPFLFSGLPSVVEASTTGEKAIKVGVDVAEAVLGVSSAHAATEPPGRTLESAAEARIARRNALVDAIGVAGERRTAATAGEKSALQAISDAKSIAKTARNTANGSERTADKAKAALDSQQRTLKKIQARMPENLAKMRADKLEELRSAEETERARIAPATEEAERTAAAAKIDANAAKAADDAVAAAVDSLKAAKAEIKAAAVAEADATKAVETFDRQEQNRSFPVSVFISSKTGMVSVRQGFEKVLEAQASIENPDVPLDTFIFTATDWKDNKKADLKWTATEVTEYSTSIGSFDDEQIGSRKKKTAEAITMPPQTDALRASRTLDRIKLPQDVADRITEVMKPGSTLIVSSYDVARSETRYRGTDFIVQMPEVVAKISRPKPKKLEVVDDDNGSCFFFCSPYSSSKPSAKDKKRQRIGSSKSW